VDEQCGPVGSHRHPNGLVAALVDAEIDGSSFARTGPNLLAHSTEQHSTG
jgi:hypothetical protein